MIKKKQYLDASVLITSDEALLGVVDYSEKRFGHNGIVHSGDVLNRKTHTGQHDIEINSSALPGNRHTRHHFHLFQPYCHPLPSQHSCAISPLSATMRNFNRRGLLLRNLSRLHYPYSEPTSRGI